MDVIDIIAGKNKALAILRGSGAVGYEETNVYSMTADADVTGKVTDSTGFFIKISDYTPTMDEFNGQMITGVFSNGEIKTQELKLEDTLQQISDEAFAVSDCFLVVNKAGAEVDGSVFPEVGIYTIHPREFAENKWESIAVTLKTIHPIDPKYLPGVCLPVVELSTVYKYGSGLTEEESAMFNAVSESKALIVSQKSSENEVFIYPTLCLRQELDGFVFFICYSAKYGDRIYAYDSEAGHWVMGA